MLNSSFQTGSNTLDFHIFNGAVNNTPGTNSPFGTKIVFTSLSATGSDQDARAVNVAEIHTGNSTIAINPPRAAANGTNYSEIIITLRNALNLPVTGLIEEVFSLTFIVNENQSTTVTFTEFEDLGNGQYRFRARNSKVENGDVEVRVLGIDAGSVQADFFNHLMMTNPMIRMMIKKN